MTLAALNAEARAEALVLRGALHEDGWTVLLLGPDEPGFWPVFAASGEYADGAPDPLDRWSKRVIGRLAARWGGKAAFPSDGPPYPPFLRWATEAGTAWTSPVGPLVHDEAGLLISYRGAVLIPGALDLPPPPENPCPACSQPCATACPVGALAPGRLYDVPACQAYLRTEAGTECRLRGCRVRHACPLSQNLHRSGEQAAFHMRSFMGNWPGPGGDDA